MNEISVCISEDCPKRNECLRGTLKPTEKVFTAADFYKGCQISHECPYFYPIFYNTEECRNDR